MLNDLNGPLKDRKKVLFRTTHLKNIVLALLEFQFHLFPFILRPFGNPVGTNCSRNVLGMFRWNIPKVFHWDVLGMLK